MNFLDWKTKTQKKTRLQQLEEYYKNRTRIPRMIDAYAPKQTIIHGSVAADMQLPVHLRSVRIQDRDLMVPPGQQKKIAKQIEAAIEKQIGNHLTVQKSKKTKGVYRIKSKYSGQTYADVMPMQRIQYKIINGRKYRTLSDMKRHAQKTLRNRTATHRKKQDQDFLQRVRLANLRKARQVLAKKHSLGKKRSHSKRRFKVSLW